MKFWPQFKPKSVGLSLFVLLLHALAQVSNPVPDSNGVRDTPIVLSRVKVVLDGGSPAIEITSSRRIVPNITTSDRPRRIIVDLQDTEMSISEKRIKVHSEDIAGIRLHQFTTSPPTARLVVDLRKPLSYTVDNVDDKLILRLHLERDEAQAKPPSIPAVTKSTEAVAVPVSPASYGNVVSADQLVSGASVTAGHDTMLLRLPRGGEVYVCPSTSVSITRSPNGADLMIAMSTGALETHYALEHSTDAIVTPDFRILLRGPGEFHYAISADSRGDTCMRGLPGNTATALVSELLGNGVYEVEPDDKIVFHMGHVSATDTALHAGSTHIVETALPQDCGCPPPRVPELIASNGANPNLQGAMRLAQPDDWQKKEPSTSLSASEGKIGDSSLQANAGPETAALPALKADEPHVMISAPIVFNAPTVASPPPVEDSRDLPIVSAGRFASIQPEVAPPVAAEAIDIKPHRGFGARLKHVLKAIFR